MAYSLFSPSYDPLVDLTNLFLDYLNAKVTPTTVNDALQHHPDYPSLLSVSDTLHQWNVSNLAVQVDLSKLKELPTPFIAHSKSSQGEQFRLVTSVEEDAVEYSDHKDKRKVISIEDFQKEWSGIVLLAEANEESGEKNYLINLRKERRASLLPLVYVVIGLIFTGLGIALIFTQFAISSLLKSSWAFLLLLKYTGVLVTLFLLWTEVGQANSLIRKVCGGGSNKKNCQAILQSKGAHLSPGLSWSEIGFFYFTGGWLIIMIASFTGHGEVFSILALFSLLSLPYIFFSLYYQWRVVQQWCTLCLTVLAVVLLEIASFGIVGFPNHFVYLNQIDFTNLVESAFALTFPIVIWYFFKTRLIRLKERESEIKPLQRLKFDPNVFHGLLKRQTKMPEIPEDFGIVLHCKKKNGSKPDVNLLQVCNPYCSACAEVQPHIEELLEKVENLSVKIVFSVKDDPRDPAQIPVKHFLSINPEDHQKIKEALHDWYSWGAKDYAAFTAKYPVNGQIDQQEWNIAEMARWCDEAGITHTPTFFVNGYPLPDGYYVNDLKYLLFQT